MTDKELRELVDAIVAPILHCLEGMDHGELDRYKDAIASRLRMDFADAMKAEGGAS